MSFCERVNVEKLEQFIQNELQNEFSKKNGKIINNPHRRIKRHAYVNLKDNGLNVNLANFGTEKICPCLLKDFEVKPLGEISNDDLNALILAWNKFLIAEFGKEYLKAHHDYYFKNTDVDILKNEDTQEK